MIVQKKEDIGAVIKSYRFKKKMTQKALAESLGVFPLYINRLENGEVELGIKDKRDILTKLDLKFDF